MRIAFVTDRRSAGLTDDDRLAVGPLSELGVTVVPAVWDDPGVAWSGFDLVVLRSTWDYFRRPDAWHAWLDARAADGTRLRNPATVVAWNSDKRYLAELERAGVPIVPTRWVDAPGEPLDRLLDGAGWDRAVVKPRVSGGAHGTERVSRDGAAEAQAHLDALAASGGAMVQPFLTDVVADGEWSLIFFGGCYSHAVRKRPRGGDFRVQTDHGGSVEPAGAPAELLDAARRAVAAAPPCLYARVDGVATANGFLLMELELVEPALFLHADPAAPRRFAGAIHELVSTAAR